MSPAAHGSVIFRCPNTGKDFDSGLVASESERAAIAAFAIVVPGCPECGRSHELKFAEGRIEVRPVNDMAHHSANFERRSAAQSA